MTQLEILLIHTSFEILILHIFSTGKFSKGIYKFEWKKYGRVRTKPLIINTLICRIFLEITNTFLSRLYKHVVLLIFHINKLQILRKNWLEQCAKVRVNLFPFVFCEHHPLLSFTDKRSAGERWYHWTSHECVSLF